MLVTGGAGYKGVKVVQALLEKGFRVTILDNFMYGCDSVLHLLKYENLDIVRADIRNDIDNIGCYDIIIHLAGISGYPACEANVNSAQLINVGATGRLVHSLSKSQLLIYASTTSFYGNSGKVCDEDTVIRPSSMYGITKYQAEQIVAEKENAISLRFATVFGVSPRMRTDLMVNDFTYRAVSEGTLVLFDGYAKRTFIHIEDAAVAYLFAIEHRDEMKGNIYNAGGNELNYSKTEVARIIQRKVDFSVIESGIKGRDVRNFIVLFDKIEKLGFRPKRTIEEGVIELLRLFRFFEPHSQ